MKKNTKLLKTKRKKNRMHNIIAKIAWNGRKYHKINKKYIVHKSIGCLEY